MITDTDVRKLSKVFATKNDLDKKLKPIHKKIDTLDTKFDHLDIRVGRLETKVTTIDTKVDAIDKNLKDLTEFVVPALGKLFEWTDDIHRAIVGSHKKLASDN